jgi:hypothetical protein
MSRDDVKHWLGDNWGKALLAGAFAVGLYVARLEAKFARLDEAAVYQGTVFGIGRLVCVKEPDMAALAGIPCGELLNKGGR